MLIVALCVNAGILGVIAVFLWCLVQETAGVHAALHIYSAQVRAWTERLAQIGADSPRKDD